jgi:hypothetical protein
VRLEPIKRHVLEAKNRTASNEKHDAGGKQYTESWTKSTSTSSDATEKSL